jgi:hypothetical protein
VVLVHSGNCAVPVRVVRDTIANCSHMIFSQSNLTSDAGVTPARAAATNGTALCTG